jgi:hypothetical protein
MDEQLKNRISDGTNEIYYNDGLIVTIYPNVEPSADWEGFGDGNGVQPGIRI